MSHIEDYLSEHYPPLELAETMMVEEELLDTRDFDEVVFVPSDLENFAFEAFEEGKINHLVYLADAYLDIPDEYRRNPRYGTDAYCLLLKGRAYAEAARRCEDPAIQEELFDEAERLGLRFVEQCIRYPSLRHDYGFEVYLPLWGLDFPCYVKELRGEEEECVKSLEVLAEQGSRAAAALLCFRSVDLDRLIENLDAVAIGHAPDEKFLSSPGYAAFCHYAGMDLPLEHAFRCVKAVVQALQGDPSALEEVGEAAFEALGEIGFAEGLRFEHESRRLSSPLRKLCKFRPRS